MRFLLPRYHLLYRQRGRCLPAFCKMVSKNILCLFDVDGTITSPRQKITPVMEEFLKMVRSDVASVGLVGGSDLSKISEQVGENALKNYDYVFAENGLVALKSGQLFHSENIALHVSEENLQELINFVLAYLSQIKLPFKRGTFIEFRKGLINISPVGRNCSQEERNAFAEYDKEHKIRQKFIDVLRHQFPQLNLVYSIGGQISFDVFPEGWDKTYCLGLLQDEGFQTIHFFGDKIMPGGNDYEIYNDSRTIGHAVVNPDDTIAQVKALFNI